MNIIRTLVTIISLSFIASNSFASNEDTARSWINAAYAGKEEMIASVKEIKVISRINCFIPV